MSTQPVPKYPAEFILDFRSVDRFLYRVSDLELTGQLSEELQSRVDGCHVYIVGKRPLLSIVPESITVTDSVVSLQVEYKLDGSEHQASFDIPRREFRPEECTFDCSPHPHRELISRNASGEVIASTLLANFGHLMPAVHQKAKDLEVLYIGKGLHKSAQDRLKNHSTLQKILADINSNQPNNEIFVLVYAFNFRKNAIAFTSGFLPEIMGDAAKRRREKAMDYRPSLDDQISLIEASCISYFQPAKYNRHYLGFPNNKPKMLSAVHDADFAAITIQLDNTNIGNLRTYSSKVKPDSTHYIVVDFRRLEGKMSVFDVHNELKTAP
jgi:hypothetical protein